MKTFTICGSMRFSEQMKEIAYYLESDKRYNILQCTYCTDDITPTQDEIMQITKANYKKIDLNDRKLQLFLNGVMLTFHENDGVYRIYNNQKFIGLGVIKKELLKRDIVIEVN